MVTGAISSLKRPAFCAASARFCEVTANRSWSSRVICQRAAMFSAVWPMWYPWKASHRPSLIMVSTRARSPIFWPPRSCWAWGDWLMLSWPPAMTISAEPSRICWAASATARRPDPQSWFRLHAGLSTGMPAFTAACRAGP